MLRRLGLVVALTFVVAGCSFGESPTTSPVAGSGAPTSSGAPATAAASVNAGSSAGLTDAHGCPTDGAGLTAIVQAVDQTVTVGDVTTMLGITSFTGQFTDYTSTKPADPFGTFDPNAPGVTGTPGEILSLTAQDPELVLTGSASRLYKRSAVVDANDVVNPDPGQPFGKRSDKPDASGALPIYLPRSKGDYVYEFQTTWSLPCVKGSAVLYLPATVN